MSVQYINAVRKAVENDDQTLLNQNATDINLYSIDFLDFALKQFNQGLDDLKFELEEQANSSEFDSFKLDADSTYSNTVNLQKTFDALQDKTNQINSLMIESRLISAEEHVLEKSILTSKTKLSELQYLNKCVLHSKATYMHWIFQTLVMTESLIHSVNQKIEPSLFISLQKQGVELKSVLSNSLHQLIENCLGVSVDNLLYIIQIPRAIDSKVIKSYLPATAPYIQSKDVFLASRKISLETDYLSRFANLLLKDVIVPISKAKSLSMIIEEGFIEVRHDSYDSDSVNPIDCLTCIFKIISAYIHSSICDTTAMDTLSALIWDPMCKSIIENILEPNLPKELDDIEPFQQQFAAMCASFEADMTLIGNTWSGINCLGLCRGEESGLQNYISSAYNILSEKKVRNHISNAKDIISSNSYDTIVLRNERHNGKP
ncbi:hypothetical protein HDV02_006240 [Globomyces sp. JEL0801]|nr:hypothetical protein HDV02_006240 [Globomyces sp. JEL0801]